MSSFMSYFSFLQTGAHSHLQRAKIQTKQTRTSAHAHTNRLVCPYSTPLSSISSPKSSGRHAFFCQSPLLWNNLPSLSDTLLPRHHLNHPPSRPVFLLGNDRQQPQAEDVREMAGNTRVLVNGINGRRSGLESVYRGFARLMSERSDYTIYRRQVGQCIKIK